MAQKLATRLFLDNQCIRFFRIRDASIQYIKSPQLFLQEK